MDRKVQKRVTDFFGNYVSTHKKELIEQVLKDRTRYLTVVLEDIYHPQNASAAVRTCDCFGIQEIHIIENKNKYEINPRVVLGASKWVDIIPYNESAEDNTRSCIEHLKRNGYRIVGTSPGKNSKPIEDLTIDGKVALLYGTELHGLSQQAMDLSDEIVHIPMFGFTESFNLSVSVAISLNIVVNKLRQSAVSWSMEENEKAALRLAWYKKVVDRSEILEKVFLKEIGQDIESQDQ